jgi:subtilisin family serine protease
VTGRRGPAGVGVGLILAATCATVLTAPPALAASQEVCVKGALPQVVAEPWAQQQLGVATLAAGFEGWNTRIAVIAAGVDAGHPQLHGHVAAGATIGVTADPQTDCLGGGTAIAGAAAAAPVSGGALRGLAPQSLIIPIRLPGWMATPTEKVPDDHAAQASELLTQAVREALARQATIIVLPGIGLAPSAGLRQAISDADRDGAVLIEPIPPAVDPATSYPLAYPEVIGVVARSQDGALAPTTAEAALIDLSAPGVDVIAVMPGGGYTQVSDSRVAAGFVAGAAALVQDHGARPAPAQIRQRLIGTAIREPGLLAVPVLSPADALGPEPAPVEAVRVPAVGLDHRTPTADPSRQISFRFSLTCLSLLVLCGAGAAAYQRGRARQWASAETLPADQLISPPRSRSI